MSGPASKCERPVERYQPPDWHARNASLVTGARTSRQKSVNLREDAKLLQMETDTRTKWHNYDNNIKLSRRITDIEHWRKQIEKALHEVCGEISVLQNSKEACERALEAKALPSDVTTECISIRETRRQFEVVRDPVEHSLNAEAKLISQIRYLLKDKCESAYDQLASLENIRQRLEHDLQDKTEALKIDSDQLGLTERSTGLSFKPDPLKVPNGSVQPDAWQDHSVQNKAEAEREMAKAQNLREAIYHLIEQTNNDLKVQQDATNFDFRKRMYEMKRAKEELEYQIKKTDQELEEQERTTRELEVALKAKENPLKLAETRLENRKMRPHMELCFDVPLDGLVAEVQAIRQSMQMLHDKLEASRESMTDLQARLKDLQDDHAHKSLALSLDQKCMGVRERLPSAYTTQSDKNLKLTGTLRNTARFLENSTVTTN